MHAFLCQYGLKLKLSQNDAMCSYKSQSVAMIET